MLLNVLLMALISAVVAAANPPADNGERVVILRSADEGGGGGAMYRARTHAALADDAQGEHERLVMLHSGETVAQPAVWLGLRITPVPAPLAAHIGARGVMIGNVVVGSPADAAGLQQYDVVVAVGETEVATPAELLQALHAYAAGDAIPLRLVRAGQELAVTLTGVERPQEPSAELKFEEPEDVLFDRDVHLRGRVLQLGKDGQWLMKDLGALEDLPDVLKDLDNLKFDFKFDLESPDGPLPPGKRFRIFNSLGDGVHSLSLPGVRMQVHVMRDGASMRIETDTEGRIHVTRADADGNETTAVYDSAEALEQADEEAFRMYEAHGSGMMLFRPEGRELLKLRRTFQIDVEKRLREALDKARDARDHAIDLHHSAAEMAQEARQLVRATVRDGVVESTSERILIRPDGSIEVRIKRDGEESRYAFDSEEAFRAAEPELHGRLMGKE